MTHARARALAFTAILLAPVAGWAAWRGDWIARQSRAASALTRTCQAKSPSSARGGSAVRRAVVMVRVNQLGYVQGCPKRAFVMAQSSLAHDRFDVVDTRTGRSVLHGALGRSRGAFNARWRFVYGVDFSAVTRAGRFVIEVGRARSPVVSVASARELYLPLAGDALSFFEQQRDGPDVIPGPLQRAPSHLRDAHAAVFAIPAYRGLGLVGNLTPTGAHVDASGGWFDAGDYLKFVETASFSDALMLFTLREYPGGVPDPTALRAEARFGTDWLLRMWDQDRRVLYYQVGIGDGNGRSVLGDHDLWRLPQADDLRRVRPGSPAYYVTNRPVFAADHPGQPISPNLAGRVAAAFALCAQVFAANDPAYARRCLLAGQTIFDLADTNPRGPELTTSPHAYYDEPEWRDDLQLGATELYLATRQLGPQLSLPHNKDLPYYLTQAGRWANAYASNASTGTDSLNLYDVSSLADYELIHILRTPLAQSLEHSQASTNVATDIPSLLSDRGDQLKLATKLSSGDAFGLSNPSSNVDTVAHALGYAVQARLYDQLTGRPEFEALAQNQLAWVLGANPWGSSFVVGAGRMFPHCLAHQVANLSGSLTGSGRILRGATVDGPSALSGLGDLGAPDGARRCPVDGHDPFRSLTSRSTGYLDDVQSSNTSEPSDDFAALTLLAAAQQAAG